MPNEDGFSTGTGGGLRGVESESRLTLGSGAGVHKSRVWGGIPIREMARSKHTTLTEMRSLSGTLKVVNSMDGFTEYMHG